MDTPISTSNQFSHSSNQAPNNPSSAKRSRQNDPNSTVTQMDYSLTTFTPTALTTQSQQCGQNTIPPENNKLIGAPVPIPVSIGKIAKIPTLIITTNIVPNLVQQPISAVDLQPSDLPGLSEPEDTLTTEPNLLTADNLALLSDSTANSQQDLPIDTHSNATIESLPKKSYTT
ncbi:10884_t:CDS:1, partial [Dentiscutata erythropus]